MSHTVIEFENVWKEYRLGTLGHGTLYRDLQSWWARLRGKEDPNALIGDVERDPSSADRFWALQDLNFSVQEGDVLGIVGKNGAGKSTLLKILSRVTLPTRGEIRIKGRCASLLEIGTGFHPELTGRENIYLNGAILGMNRAEIDRKLDEIIAFSGIEQFIDTPVKRYSSGMYVRLAFAVAAHLDPEILVVYEVLAVGDFEFQAKCLDKMRSASQSGRTVLFVSHNLQAVTNLCTRAILLQKGRMIMNDDVQSVLRHYVQNIGSEGGQIIWGEDGPSSPEVRIERIRMLRENGLVSSEFPFEERIGVEITFRVLMQRVFFPTIHIKNLDGVACIASTNFPAMSVTPDPAYNTRLEVGLHRTMVWIPSHFMMDGDYLLDVVMAVTPGIRVGAYAEDALKFTVADSIELRTQYSLTTGGMVMPRLDWRTEPISEAEALSKAISEASA